jgi:carbamoyl-phosphate synthase small subunit
MKYITKDKAVLLLEDGTFYTGYSIGMKGTSGGEICFNTGMTGYQEIYTDPSYFGQIVVNTNSHIGNYGTLAAEEESSKPKISGLVVNYFSDGFSRPTGEESLNSYLTNNTTVGISGLDTRALVRHIRSKGAMNAIISSVEFDKETLTALLNNVPSMNNLELASQVTTDLPYLIGDQNSEIRIAVLDLGCKKSILSNFVERGAYLKVFPAKSTFSDMQKWTPDGYFISNGPGDPSVMDYATKAVKDILAANKPLFGICLGHQILAQACGISTYKMHHGHRGLNHPVKNLSTGKGEITSQNHGFAVDLETLKKADNVELTHVNLNDGTVAGIRLKNKDAFSVQYHPESSPGPHDSRYLFDDFINILKSKK